MQQFLEWSAITYLKFPRPKPALPADFVILSTVFAKWLACQLKKKFKTLKWFLTTSDKNYKGIFEKSVKIQLRIGMDVSGSEIILGHFEYLFFIATV